MDKAWPSSNRRCRRFLLAAVWWAVAAACGGGEPPPGSVRFERLGAAHGLRQYVPGAWGIVGVDLTNPGTEAAEVLATFRFAAEPDLEYARRLTVPPRAVRRSWVPVLLPEVHSRDDAIECLSLLIDDRSGSEVVLRQPHEPLQHRTLLPLNRETPRAALILPEADRADSEAEDAAYETLIALRSRQGLTRRTAIFDDPCLPPLPEALDGLDLLVLTNDRYAQDPAAMAAIRGWLGEGGRLWVMLDRVDPAGIARLLGESFACQVVDEVDLTEVDIRPIAPIAAHRYPPPRQFDRPVKMVRVLSSGLEVTHTVRDWPAAFQRNVGRGRVVFTTVAAEAWVAPRDAAPLRWDPLRSSHFVPLPQLEELDILAPRLGDPSDPDRFRPYLTEQIGYRIVPRRAVLAVLALFCLALVLAVGVLVRLRRLDRLIWIAPCAALAAAGPLFWQGWHASRAVPATVAELQLLRVSDIADRVAGYGLIASYQPLSPAPPAAEAGGTLAVQDSGAWRPSRRMVWTDLDRWHWPRLRLPPGLQFLSFRQRLTLSEPVQAVGTFTATGFEGRLSGPVPSPADAILAIPRRPCLAVTISDGRLSATRQDVLPRGQYSAGGVLSDEQRRRQGVYQQLLQDSPLETPFLTRPTLLVWTPPLDLHFAHPSQAERRGAALWSIPLTLQRPPAGTRLVVPAPFVSYRTVAGPGGEGASPLLDPRTGQWLDSAIGTRTWLHFQVPAELRPLELQAARLTLQLTAPGRTVDIVPAPRVSPQVPMRRTNPIGRLQFELTGDALPPEPDGGWLLGILVSDLIGADERDQAARWKIDDLQLEIRGRIPGDAP